MTLYEIKPQFQALLRPLVKTLAATGVSANQVTLSAAVVSVVLGGFIYVNADVTAVFLLIPAWLFLRMALNAIDGMLAREFDQKSTLGAYLNELGDVVSDAALYLPFALVAPFSNLTVVLVVLLATLSEFAGAFGPTVGASRRYDGPMGKSDRALVFGVLGLWLGIAGSLPLWLFWLMPLLSVLLVMTTFNRVQHALVEAN